MSQIYVLENIGDCLLFPHLNVFILDYGQNYNIILRLYSKNIGIWSLFLKFKCEANYVQDIKLY